MSIGENIKKIRKTKGLTQSMLADMLGVNQSAISNFENSKQLRKGTIEKIAKALEVTTDELLFGSNHFQDINNESGHTVAVSTNLLILQRAESLNELGKTELLKYADLLASNDKYKKEE